MRMGGYTDMQNGKMNSTQIMKQKSGWFGSLRFWLKRYVHIAIPGTILILLIVIMSFLAPTFLTTRNLISIARASAIYMMLAVGMTFVITSRGIDLSIGSILGLTSVVMGGLVIDYGWHPYAGLMVAIAMGCGLGLFNGVLVTVTRIPPFIATIGMMTAYRGFALVHSAGKVRYHFPEEITWLGQGMIGGIPVPVYMALIMAFIAHLIFRNTGFGRYCVAIGGNKEAARRTGIPVKLYETSYYVLMGAICGFAGVVLTGRLDGTQAVLGEGMELHVIAAVIIGGTSLFGGRGSVTTSVLGALVLGVVDNALILLGVPWFWQRVALGFIVVGAVIFNRWREDKARELLRGS